MRQTIIILAFIGLSLAACNNAGKQPAKKQYKFYCTMHPHIGSDKPGICPKCGMPLVERETNP